MIPLAYYFSPLIFLLFRSSTFVCSISYCGSVGGGGELNVTRAIDIVVHLIDELLLLYPAMLCGYLTFSDSFKGPLMSHNL